MTFTDFLSAYSMLRRSLPRPPTGNIDNENCDYTGYTYHSADCYYTFDCAYNKRCLYLFDSVRCVDCVDGDYDVDCEKLYGCVDCLRAYNSTYLDYCARIYDSHFCWDCIDSHDLFGCTHLRQKQYCICNRQYTQEEYKRRLAGLLARPSDQNLLDLKNLIRTYPFGPSNVTHSENSSYGNHVHYALNLYLCYDAAHDEDCGYLYDSFYCKNSYDLTQCAQVELCYECRDSSKLYNCRFADWSSNCYDSAFLANCVDCHNCFGCAELSHAKNCILNRQYTPEEYTRTVSEVMTSFYPGFQYLN